MSACLVLLVLLVHFDEALSVEWAFVVLRGVGWVVDCVACAVFEAVSAVVWAVSTSIEAAATFFVFFMHVFVLLMLFFMK
jgi:hypothetical protein